jgi:Mor family transcriptional regulator
MTIKINSDDDAVSLRFEIAAILREEMGLHEQYATTLAEPIVNGLKKRFSGQEIYIAKTERTDIAVRDENIRQEFNGRNLVQIMRKYKLGKSSIYKIVGKK